MRRGEPCKVSVTVLNREGGVVVLGVAGLGLTGLGATGLLGGLLCACVESTNPPLNAIATIRLLTRI